MQIPSVIQIEIGDDIYRQIWKINSRAEHDNVPFTDRQLT